MKTVEQIVAEVWPEWKLENLIGAGAFGEVYKATREDLAGTSSAAIKVMKVYRPRLPLREEDKENAEAEMNRILERFGREIRMMQSLKGQTNLVNIEDHQTAEDRENGILYILIRMELLTPLMEDMEIHGIGEERIIRLGTDLCRGLEVCEGERIVHRDIKPANIFVNRLGDYKLGDFSVARTMDMNQAAFTARDDLQMERFAAPEVKNGTIRYAGFEEGSRADIYSLGMVLYWAANGMKPPFLPDKQLYTSNDREQAEERRLSGEALPELNGISPALQAVIRKACDFDPTKRFADAGAFRVALEQAGKAGPDRTNADRKKPKTPKRRMIPAAAALFAVLLAAALWLLVPVRVPVQYRTGEDRVLCTETVSLRPGTALSLLPQAEKLPDGYAPENGEEQTVSVDLLRRASPAEVRFLCREAAAQPLPETLTFAEISWPAVYAIGKPLLLPGCIESNADLTKISLNLYTADRCWPGEYRPAPGTKRWNLSEAGEELFWNLDEGPFWYELIASDAEGRTVGFSNLCTASYLAEEHTVYSQSRVYGEPELKGSFVYGGHSYEVYRLPGGGWNASNLFAQGKGGHLVTFSDEKEFQAVTSYCLGMGVRYVNIGAQYTDGRWSWTDGSEFSYQVWKPAEGNPRSTAYEPVGAAVYTAAKQWYYGEATQYEIANFIVEYEDVIR